jgi:hypothetical protein
MKFRLGQLLATPAALRALQESGQAPGDFLRRHLAGDWGQVCAEDWELNDQALRDGGRVLSAYSTLMGQKVWVITEADRSVTTLLLPAEY